MSVLVTLKVPGDTEKFRAFAASNGDMMVAISERGRAAGAIHHRFAISDGEVAVFDEWDSAESFQGFFAANEAEIGAVMQGAGASGPPVITFHDAVETADAF